MSWLLALLMSVAVLGVAMTFVAYLSWIERKVAARFQNRVGPYWVGYPHGWLQPIADLGKLITKEDLVPRKADRLLFNLAPIMLVVPALLGFAFIPFGPGLAIFNHQYSFLLFLAFGSLGLLGIFAAGWSSNNKYALLSALRMVAMAVSYEIPLLLSLLVPALLAGSFNLVEVAEAQQGMPFILTPVIGQVAFLVFFVAMIAESNKSPLDLVEAESELVSAYNVEYSGIKFGIFYAAEYAHHFAVCGLAATVFFGGYSGPAFLPGAVWLLLKMLAIFLLVLWVRWSFLRMRIDHALMLNWKVLFPISVINLLAAAYWVLSNSGGGS
jgi:NADH-quinone oxidoreductase subunit H